jgi:hypothetical protein
MIKHAKRWMVSALALVLALTMTGCSMKEMAVNLILKVVGTQDDGEDDSASLVYADAGGSITFPDGFDTTGRFNTLIQDGSLYIAFNGIANKSTGYFVTSGDSVTVTAYATTEATADSLQKFKIALWELSEDQTTTSYVTGSTVYYKTGGDCYTYTVSGLDPSRQYKVVTSYDSAKYYVTGGMVVSGVAGDTLTDVAGSDSTDSTS